jgi:hypothetical protein
VTGEVLQQGAESPGSRRGVTVGLAALLLLLVAVVVARRDAAADRRHDARPTPSPSASPSPSGIDPEPDRTALTIVTKPPAGGIASVLFARDEPGFVRAGRGGDYTALAAIGGPKHAEVLVGWCPSAQAFQDASGRYRYDRDGAPYGPGPGLARRRVEVSRQDVRYLAVDAAPALRPEPSSLGGVTAGNPLPACRSGAVVWPALPGRATTMEGAAGSFRRVTGRYVATTESFAFCPGPPRGADCRSGGWEIYNTPGVPADDLASEYVYEGEFAILTNGSLGTFRAVRLPAARLVRRSHVGVRAVRGILLSGRDAGGSYVVRLRPFGPPNGGVTAPLPDRDYVVRADAQLFLGPGWTGLGQPHATLATLRRYVASATRDTQPELAAILDARGRVQRLVEVPFDLY